MEQNFDSLIDQFVVGLIALYGLYLVITGVLIVWKDRKILDLVHYVKIGFWNLTGNRLKAKRYKQLQIKSVNWRSHGVFLIVFGLGGLLGSILVLRYLSS